MTIPRLVLGVVLLATPAWAQDAPYGVMWDYYDTDLVLYTVTHFEVCVDGGACELVAVSDSYTDANTLPGAVSFGAALPALKVGDHVATIAACNASECATPVEIAFAVIIRPVPVRNPRLRK